MAISCQDPVQHLALCRSYFLAVAFPPFRLPWRKWATAVPLRRGKELSQQWRVEVVVCSDFACRCICMGTHTSPNADLLCFTPKPVLRQWLREALKAPSCPLRAQCKGGFRSFGISLPRCLAYSPSRHWTCGNDAGSFGDSGPLRSFVHAFAGFPALLELTFHLVASLLLTLVFHSSL